MHSFPWSLSPGNGGINGITVENLNSNRKKDPCEGGGGEGEEGE